MARLNLKALTRDFSSGYLQDLGQNLTMKTISSSERATAFVKGLPAPLRSRFVNHGVAQIFAQLVADLFKLDKTTRRMIQDLISSTVSGVGAGVADVADEDWQQKVDEAAAKMPTSPDVSREPDEVLGLIVEGVPYVHGPLYDGLEIVKDADGKEETACSFVNSHRDKHKIENATRVEMRGGGKKGSKPEPVTIPGKPYPVRVMSLHAAVALKGELCPECYGVGTKIEDLPTPKREEDRSYKSANKVTKSVMLALNKTLSTMRGSDENMAETSAVYDYLVDLVKDIRNPFLIPDISDIEEMAEDVHPRITSEGLLTFEDLGYMVTALLTSGAELEKVRKWRAAIESFFKGKAKNGKRVTWTTAMFTAAKRYSVYSLILLFVLMIPWILTLVPGSFASYSAMGTGILFTVVFLVVAITVAKVSEWASDTVTEILLDRDDFVDLEDLVRGLSHGMMMGMLMCMGINFIKLLVDPWYGYVVLMVIVAGSVSFWYGAVKARKAKPIYGNKDDPEQVTGEVIPLGLVPIIAALVLTGVSGYFTYLEKVAQEAAFELEIRWKAAYSEKGTQINTLVVPLPNGEMLAEDVFDSDLFSTLQRRCNHPEKNNKLRQKEARDLRRAIVDYHKCSDADSKVRLSKVRELKIDGMVVVPVADDDGYNRFRVKETGWMTKKTWLLANWKLFPSVLIALIVIATLWKIKDNHPFVALGVVLALFLLVGIATLMKDSLSEDTKPAPPPPRIYRSEKAKSPKQSGGSSTQKNLCDLWKRTGSPKFDEHKCSRYY